MKKNYLNLKKRTLLFNVLIILFLISCTNTNSSSNQSGKSTEKDSLVYGKVLKSIACLKNPDNSFALYLPANFNKEKKYPVLICFDAHARGKMPVSKLQQVAEELGYIVVGSNNAKNGLTTINQVVNVLFEDVFARFPIDTNRVYLLGFSGGGRLAISVAMNGGVAGVISLSAGIQGLTANTSLPFSLITLAGTEDFNYFESVENDQLIHTGNQYITTLFSGKHEYPANEILTQSVYMLDIFAMKKNLIPKNETIIQKVKLYSDSLLSVYQKNKWEYGQYLILKKIAVLETLIEVAFYKKQLQGLENKGVVEQEALLLKEELKMRDELSLNLFVKNYEWLKNEVINLKKKIDTESNISKKNRLQRILNYQSMVCYMNTSKMIEENKFEMAKAAVEKYRLVDPLNTDMFYFSAMINTSLGDSPNAIIDLENAVKNDFTDWEKMQNEFLLSPLQNQPKYAELIETAKQNSLK